MLVIKNMSKYYNTARQTVQALKNVSLKIDDKGFVVLLGKSGSGKSTLLNIIGGLDNFDCGELIINNTSTKHFKGNDWDSYRNSYVGVVFQEFYLIEDFTVGKNISIALELQGYPKDKIDEKVIDILNQVDLCDYKDKLPNQLSGGQKQRIAIARALVKEPKIILADEPTGNLDLENGRLILDILKRLSKNKLVIMVTHDIDFANKYGDRVIELKDGLVINDYLNIEGVNNQTIYDVDNKDYKKIIKVPKGEKLSLYTINYINEILLNSDNKLYLSLINNKNYVKKYVPNIEDSIVNSIDSEGFETSINNEKLTIKKTSMPFKYAFKLAFNSIFKKKFRLTLMLLLFISSLIFLGISTSFSFYDVAKASTLTFEKAGLNHIPIDKRIYHCDDLRCRYVFDSFTKEDIESFKTKYKNINFVTSYSRNILITDLVDTNNIAEDFYHANGFNKITLIDETKSAYELLVGKFPMNNEVLITDYMAEIFLYNKIFSNVSNVNDLINKNITYNYKPVKIAGIVKTDYKKYEHTKTDEFKLAKGYFYNDLNGKYLSFFMTQDTYENTFYKNSSSRTFFYNKDKDTEYINSTIFGFDNNFKEYIIGKLPENDYEIVVSLTTLINNFDFKIDSPDEIQKHLNKIISLRYQTYENFNYNQGTFEDYTIVGILNDNEIDMPKFNFMFTSEKFKSIDNTSPYKRIMFMTAVLGNNDVENYRFLNYLNEINYKHDTQYSKDLYNIENFTNKIENVLNIMSGVFIILTLFLFYTFISISINNKQKEIGTLRAIGSRGIDVSKIFVTESTIIAFFSSCFASLATIIIITKINKELTRSFKLDIVLLYIDFTTILLIFVFSIIVMFISTVIPIKRITLMKPIKAIKGLK